MIANIHHPANNPVYDPALLRAAAIHAQAEDARYTRRLVHGWGTSHQEHAGCRRGTSPQGSGIARPTGGSGRTGGMDTHFSHGDRNGLVGSLQWGTPTRLSAATAALFEGPLDKAKGSVRTPLVPAGGKVLQEPEVQPRCASGGGRFSTPLPLGIRTLPIRTPFAKRGVQPHRAHSYWTWSN